MIHLDHVLLSYGNESVLEDVTLRVRPGEHTALMGPSGCGKSSLLQLAAGLVSPARGSAEITANKISYVFQEPRLLPSRTALQNVNAVLGGRKTTLPEAKAWLSRLGLADALDKYPAELSGGMRQRVNIARALAFDGDLLLLDEPFAGLDEARRDDVLSLLQEYAAKKTLLLATHDRTEADALCDRIYTYANKRFQ